MTPSMGTPASPDAPPGEEGGGSLTRRLARRIRALPVSDGELGEAERFVRDWIGSLGAGGATGPGRALLAAGDPNRDLEQRTFLAAALSHVTETDDLHRESTTHPGCVVIPCAFLVSRLRGLGGAGLLQGVLAGYEAMLRIGEALGPTHYRTFHNTSTAGVFGAAAAAARLLELDEDGWVWALGNAGTQAAGLWQFNEEGAMSKPLHAGHAARAGLRAALLAREGFTGPEKILEGEKGFFRAFCPDARPGAVLRDADGWKLAETSLKPYPSCRHTHPVIDAALEVREGLRKRGRAPEAIRSVRIGSYRAGLDLVDRPRPESPHAARFSVQYCTATALLHGAPGLETFGSDRIRDDGAARLLAVTEAVVDPELDDAYPRRWGGEVRIVDGDGTEWAARRLVASGDPEAPLDDRALDRKVEGLLVHGGMGRDEARRVLALCRALPRDGELPALPHLEGEEPASGRARTGHFPGVRR